MIGGSVVYLYNIVAHLPPEQVTVITPARPQHAEFDAVQPFRIVRGRPHADEQRLMNLGFNKTDKVRAWLDWFTVLVSLLRHERYDLLHLGDVYKAGAVGWLIARLFQLPYIVYVYAEELTGQLKARDSRAGLRRWLFRRVLRGAAGIIGVSDYTLSLLPAYGVPVDKPTLKVVPMVNGDKGEPHASTAEVKARYGLRPDQPLVLCAGRLIERKGQDMLIRAWPQVVQVFPEARLIIAGDGPHRDVVRQLAVDSPARESLLLAGRVSDEELSDLFDACDVFIMPHRELGNGDTEGCPTVFLEAGAHGKAVIGGQAGGVRDAILDGETGLIVDGAQPDQIAAAIKRLLADPDLARRLGEANRRRVLTQLTPELAAAQVLDFSQRIVAVRQ